MSTIYPTLAPVVKWVGGKRQLLKELLPRVPNFNAYFEPFVGGGAMMFAISPKTLRVNDLNADLIDVYTSVRDNLDDLVATLRKHENTKEHYYEVRTIYRDRDAFSRLSVYERAAMFIYLNKTCFNGLYRVNGKGLFNAAYGYYENPTIVDLPNLTAIHEYFNRCDVRFSSGDFEAALTDAQAGDFVYLDPPYHDNFSRYTKEQFSENDQRRVRAACEMLDKRGVKFMLSNSDTAFIRELYSGLNVATVSATRRVNCDASKRGAVNEVLVTNY